MSEEEKLLKDAKKWAWEDRLAHKNWKVRNDANVDLAATCDGILDPKDPRLREIGPLFRKAVSDSNAPAQEKALDALIAYLKAADADAGRYAKEICDVVASKCLTGRPKTIEKAQTVFLLWVELEAVETFLDAMEKALKNKVAKAVVPAIDAIYQAVSQFGTKIVPAKRILKMLPELFDHQDQNVRAAAKGLTVEMCRWIGREVVKSVLFEKMRDSMKKEVELELETVSGVSKPTRKIRSEQDKIEEQVLLPESTGSEKPESSDDVVQDVDDYDFMDPVDILTPLSKGGFWEAVKATKWSERRDAVAELTKLASAKKLAVGDYVEVSRVVKKLIADVNIAVAVEAVQAAGNLARGLRKDFSSGSRLLLPLLLEKYKERKQLMVDALTQTLQNMHKYGCLQLGDLVEEVKVATKNKVPAVRSLSLTWVGFCIETSPKAVVLKLHKDYVPILMEGLQDGTPDVRDAAFNSLAALAKLVGMKPLERPLEKLDEVRRKKLTELIGVSGGGGSQPPPSAPSKGQTSGPPPPPSGDDGGGGNRSAAGSLSGRKPPAKPSATSKVQPGKSGSGTRKAEGAQTKPSGGPAPSEDNEPTGEVSLEELESRLSAILPADVVVKMKSAAWKDRLEGIVALSEKVEAMTELDQYVETIVRLLALVPGWGEKNFQVQQKVFEVIAILAQNASKFSKRCVFICLSGTVEKIADLKTRAQASKCLTTFCEAVGPSFVMEKVSKIIVDHKNPKVVNEIFLWMVTAIDDFGTKQIRVKEVLDVCRDFGLASSAAATRTSAIKVIGCIHRYVGPDVKGFLGDLKPALLTLVEAEFERNPFVGVVAPKRIVRGVEAASAGSGGDGELPREDISGKISATLVKNITHSDWKIRQEAIEGVNKLLEEAHRRIQTTGTGELITVLRTRLADSNKNIVCLTLSTLGNIAQCMGPNIEKQAKGLLVDVLKCLGDNKKLVRDAVFRMLDMWLTTISLEKSFVYFTPCLTDPKIGADGRKDLCEWLGKNLVKCQVQSDAVQLVKPIVASLQDKSSEVRKAAEVLLSELIKFCGPELLIKPFRDIQGAAGTALQGSLERLKFSDRVEESSQKVGSLAVESGGAKVGKASGGRANAVVSRGQASKGGPGKGSKVGGLEDVALQGQSLFCLKDANKEDRQKNTRRFRFDDLRPDQILELENDMVKYFREDLHRKLLSTDFKKQVEGLEMLQKAISICMRDLYEVLDIVLRWTVLRFCESNTTCLVKVLDFLPELMEALNSAGFTLTDFEAGLFLPCLVEKSGHNIERVREKMREVMRHMCCIYPSSKVITFIAEGLRSKNNRTRIEAVDHIGYMIERYGFEITLPGKVMQLVLPLTTERDSETRKQALQTFSVAFKLLGDEVWKHIGRVTDAQKAVLEEKFKWKTREMEKRKEGKPGEGRASSRHFLQENGSDSVEAGVEMAGMLYQGGNREEIAMEHQYAGVPSGQNQLPCDWAEALDTIEHGVTEEQVVQGMKLVCHELTVSQADMEGNCFDDLAKDADRLVSCLTAKVTSTFNQGLAGASSRSCKYVLNTLMQTFQIKKLATGVRMNTLHNLITELLLRLLDEHVPLMDDGGQLLKALNVLMLKILENAERTSAFVVLIYLLRPPSLSRLSARANEEAATAKSQRFSDLVVKCLIKLTKVLGSTIFDVDLDRLLQCIHEYLQELGMEEIRRRAGADDKPLRMVKTVLHELVKLRGTAIKGHLSMVPIDAEPQPIILAYIDLNLQTLAAGRMLTPSSTAGQTHWGDSASNGRPSSTGSPEAQLKQELAAVFKKIGDKQTCTIGLYELYRITQLYPQVDIFSQLQNASEAFRSYIRDGLSQMEKNAAAGRSPKTMSSVTAAPVPSHSLPKTTFLPPTESKYPTIDVDTSHTARWHRDHAEVGGSPRGEYGSFRLGSNTQSFAEQQDCSSPVTGIERLEGSGSIGTLDSIRERMKNIQAAAAGSIGGGAGLSHPNGTLSGAYGGKGSLSVESSNVDFMPSQMSLSPQDDKALSELQARMERLKSGGNSDLVD